MIFFPLIVKAGQTIPVATRARSVYYESATGPGETLIQVIMQGGAGSEYMLKVGQGFRSGQDYEQLLVKNPGATDIAGFLVLGDAGFFDNRVVGTVSVSGTVAVSGVVEVVDGGRTRALQNKSFIGSGTCSGPSSYASMQLWNPAASGVNVFVDVIAFSMTGASGIFMRGMTVALPSLYGSGSAKKINGTVSKAEIRYQQAGSVPAPPFLFNCDVGANALQTLKERGAILLTPGTGVAINANQQNMSMAANFEWWEE